MMKIQKEREGERETYEWTFQTGSISQKEEAHDVEGIDKILETISSRRTGRDLIWQAGPRKMLFSVIRKTSMF